MQQNYVPKPKNQGGNNKKRYHGGHNPDQEKQDDSGKRHSQYDQVQQQKGPKEQKQQNSSFANDKGYGGQTQSQPSAIGGGGYYKQNAGSNQFNNASYKNQGSNTYIHQNQQYSGLQQQQQYYQSSTNQGYNNQNRGYQHTKDYSQSAQAGANQKNSQAEQQNHAVSSHMKHFSNPWEELSYVKYLMSEKYKVFETPETMTLRTKSIQLLQEIVETWYIQIGVEKKKMDRQQLESKKAKVLVFGSYRLGVHFTGTDIDTICVFPTFISKEEFLDDFRTYVSEKEHIEDVLKIQEALTPIIKLKVNGISFDLLYAAVDIAHINSQNDIEKLIMNESQFNRLSMLTQRSFNGYLCNANIQKFVPNYGVYRNFLRIIKLWAKRRCIYSAMFGYLTGISCAVLVAKIHQDYPDYDVVDLVFKFFEFYSSYDWQNPVTIKFGKKESFVSLNSWKNALDNVERDQMAILSPNYELRNTTQRVQEATFDTIVQEIKRGLEIMQELVPNSKKCYQPQICSNGGTKQFIRHPITRKDESDATKELQVSSWTKFFKQTRFFGRQYSNFIRIDIVANSVDDSNDFYLEWLGFVESKLFILLNLLSKQQEIQEIRAYPQSFKNKQQHELCLMDTDIAKFQFVDTYFFGFRLHQGSNSSFINLEEHAIQFCQKLDFGRIQKANTDVRILHFRREELPRELVSRY